MQRNPSSDADRIMVAIGETVFSEDAAHIRIVAVQRGIAATAANALSVLGEAPFYITSTSGVPLALQSDLARRIGELYLDELCRPITTETEPCIGQVDFLDSDFSYRRIRVLQIPDLEQPVHFAGETELLL